MSSKTTASLDEAIDYALAQIGNEETAQLVRAALFSDVIDDRDSLGPQLASAVVQAVDRRVSTGEQARAG